MWRNPGDYPDENGLSQVWQCKIWTGVIQWHSADDYTDSDSTLTKTHILQCEIFPKSDHYNGSRIWPETGLRLQLQILPKSLIGHEGGFWKWYQEGSGFWNKWFKPFNGCTHSVEFMLRNPHRQHLIKAMNRGNIGCLYFTVSKNLVSDFFTK